MALNRARPSETGTTINAELKRRRVTHATSRRRIIRTTKLYLLKKYVHFRGIPNGNLDEPSQIHISSEHSCSLL